MTLVAASTRDFPYYFIFEYMEEGTLASLIEKNPEGLPSQLLEELAGDILEGLAYLHAQTPPIIHRDLKPDNILLKNEDGRLVAKISGQLYFDFLSLFYCFPCFTAFFSQARHFFICRFWMCTRVGE